MKKIYHFVVFKMDDEIQTTMSEEDCPRNSNLFLILRNAYSKERNSLTPAHTLDEKVRFKSFKAHIQPCGHETGSAFSGTSGAQS